MFCKNSLAKIPNMTTTKENHTRKFEAEVSQVLDLVINSLYSNKDIFLRELISNSSDALDKLRFNALTNQDLHKGDEELQIKIWLDQDARKIYIQDNGIGMTEEDMVNNLGTIARSGTKEFVKALQESSTQFDSNLIGKFGVGFYSGFIVADEIEVTSRKAGQDQIVKWTSTGKGDYSIQTLETEDLKDFNLDHQGTVISMKVKAGEDYDDYLTEWQIRSIVKKYSDFIEYPIKLKVTEKTEDGKEEILWENLNTQKAIWTRSKSEIKEEEYKEFYKHLSHDFSEPLDYLHYRAEGTNEYIALLYFPAKAPFDFFMPETQKSLSLYINKVFITNEAELLLPQYLRFIKGVVDASDLPLNVSREVLQQNPRVAAIKKNITKKVLSKLKDLKEKDFDKYVSFYKEFGKILKEGVHTDFANKNEILDLLLFESTKTNNAEYTNLKDYISRLDANPAANEDVKKSIYYITGESRAELETSPYLESFKAKDIEVLFMVDPIDEWVVMSGASFENKTFQSLSKGNVNLDKDSETEKEDSNADALVAKLKEVLDNKVGEIRYSHRLVDTLCCLVTADNDISANMERIYRNAKQQMPSAKRSLELNKNHAVIKKLNEAFAANPNDPIIADYAELIYGQAQLLEGSKISDLNKFVKLVSKLME